MEHVVASGLPPKVPKHATPDARVPLAVQELQGHPVHGVLAVAGEERLLGHGKVMLLVAQNVHDVRQALPRWHDDHHARVHEAGVAIPHSAQWSTAFREDPVRALGVEAEDHVCVQQGHLRVVGEPPDAEFVHDPGPPLVNDRVAVHRGGHGNGLREVDLDAVLLEQVEEVLRRLRREVRRYDGDDVLRRAARAQGLDQHAHRDHVLGAVAVEEEGKGLEGAVAPLATDAVVAGAAARAAVAPAAGERVAPRVARARARQAAGVPLADGSLATLLVLQAEAQPLLGAGALHFPALGTALVDLAPLLAEEGALPRHVFWAAVDLSQAHLARDQRAGRVGHALGSESKRRLLLAVRTASC
mmetsp:Transcript_107565/g.304185  ORF Transcript_107565/g.304185 Transcript_107565/m.304185 type:complete len:358 (+) Transcript_107565:3434-4507(+)